MIKVFSPNQPALAYDGEDYVLIKRRLYSTRRSGPYYHIVPSRWGLNRSPYRPLLNVVSRRFYYFKVVEPLFSELDVEWVIKTIDGESVKVPYYETLPGWIHEKRVIFAGISTMPAYKAEKYYEYFVFDPDASIWVYEEKRKFIHSYVPRLIGDKTWDTITNHPWNTPENKPHIKQGGLNIWIYRALPFANDPNPLIVTKSRFNPSQVQFTPILF